MSLTLKYDSNFKLVLSICLICDLEGDEDVDGAGGEGDDGNVGDDWGEIEI